MTRYSIDTNKREVVYISLGILTILISKWVNQSLVWVYELWLGSIPDYLSISISIFSTYGLLFKIFDQYIWKIPTVITFLEIPNLNGTWKGTVTKRANGEEEIIQSDLKIHQTFTKIEIALTTDKTKSKSGTCGIRTNNSEIEIDYFYVVKDRKRDDENYTRDGVSELSLTEDSGICVLDGAYYGRGDRSGELHFTKSNKEIKNF